MTPTPPHPQLPTAEIKIGPWTFIPRAIEQFKIIKIARHSQYNLSKLPN